LNRLCHIRNRYQDEGHLYITHAAQAGADHDDVFLTTSHDGGKTCSAHVRANDDATQTDQWMPSVAVTDEGIVGVMFYDGRNDPLNNLKMDVYLAISTNHGHGFHSNQRITNTPFPPAVHFDPSSLLTPWAITTRWWQTKTASTGMGRQPRLRRSSTRSQRLFRHLSGGRLVLHETAPLSPRGALSAVSVRLCCIDGRHRQLRESNGHYRRPPALTELRAQPNPCVVSRS
jgi:hypothetical protein